MFKKVTFTLLFLFPTIVSAQKVDIPMGMRGAMPTIQLMVNDKGPFTFAIDTGAQGQARADSSLVATLGLKTVGQARAGDSSGQTRNLDIVHIDKIKIGDIEFQNIDAVSRDYNASTNLPKIDGILGFNLFADYLLTLDYTGRRVRIEPGSLPEANDKDVLNFENPRGIPIVDLSIGSQKVKANLDSGNLAGAFMLPAAVVEKASLAGEPTVVGRARTVSGDYEIKGVKINDTISLGSFEFPTPTVSYPSPSIANIGSAILQQFSLTFDQKNKRIKFEKGPSTAASDAAPVTGVNSPIADYLGQYGERRLFELNGSLYIQRGGASQLKLVSTGKDEFTIENIPAAHIKFGRDESGKVSEIQVQNGSGPWEKVKKN